MKDKKRAQASSARERSTTKKQAVKEQERYLFCDWFSGLRSALAALLSSVLCLSSLCFSITLPTKEKQKISREETEENKAAQARERQKTMKGVPVR